MSVFDALAERRYRAWVEKTSADGYRPPAAPERSATRKSLEGYLFGEILRRLDAAAAAGTPGERRERLAEARRLELRLMLLLERRDMPLAAATLGASIAARRRQVSPDD